MILREILLKNFRNYENQKIIFSDSVNIITGNNGSGKTNIIEAISILSGSKSFRNSKDKDIIKWGNDSYFCKAVIEEGSNSVFESGCISNGQSCEKKRKIDGMLLSASDFFGKILTVIFSPEDILIIDSSPENRRKYFDGVISKFDDLYLKSLMQYKKILKYRNYILKSGKDENKIKKELSVWNDTFSEKAVYITNKRSEFIKSFNNEFSEIYDLFSFNHNNSYFIYKSDNLALTKNEFLLKIEKSIRRDLNSFSTSIGPHKDDFILNSFGDRIFSEFASQGQKRIASVSMKFAEKEITEKLRGQKAVILVDDVFSELDKVRKEKFVEMTAFTNQSIFTIADTRNIEFFDLEKKIINIDKGLVL
ncbi:MAG TPA: DNA replication and repair protein RecF [Spirochaetota bacterium]|nr:DNA replication and repair protein RecF [Spirochaetota bacterium]HOR44413.1 DNA replication and repair protein RecF [Spirochaetota bacterium]HPK55896.1 DNA replication and repair protein RecF [Spirochaetota bacterium]